MWLQEGVTDTNPFGNVAAGEPPPAGVRALRVLLVKPSKYDDDGYVVRFLRGVLPSNTLAVLAGLSRRVAEERRLGDVSVEVRLLDEHVEKVEPAKLVRRFSGRGVRLLVALCGVQTNEFPRAADLARELRALGVQVMVGGFHVSGSIVLASGMPRELRELIDAGVTLVKGEVEECWDALLRDALHLRLKSFYDVPVPPDLRNAPLPTVEPRRLKKFAYPFMGTVDTGRGCPFNCSFCTIVNVQGRTMRHRSARQIKDWIRDNWRRKVDYYFFTDDNFARNPGWEAILDAVAELRRDEGIAIRFMMQTDVLAHRLAGFMKKAAAAGCTQVFLGMESLDAENLLAAGKRQNRTEDFRDMIAAWHVHGIACHVGYIIGFPFDSPASVRAAVRELRDGIGVDQASFFMLTPLPGSRDHAEMVRRGDPMDEDLNRFDSFHPTMAHPRMSAGEWSAAYHEAWRDFYSAEGMKSILERAPRGTYWGLLKNFAWYKYAMFVEETHPMVGGFFRLKDRRQRRPGYAVETRWRHLRRRTLELRRWVRGVAGLYFELQEVWLATRGREARRQALRLGTERRAALDAYWRELYGKLRRGRVLRINPLRLGFNLLRDAELCIRFNLAVLAAQGQ